MAGFAQSPLTGSSWNDLAGQAAQDTRDELAKRKKAQLAWLDRLSTYFLVKGADMPQSAGGRPV